MYRIVYWPILFFLTLFSLLPLRVHYVLSDIIYFILYKTFRYRRSVVSINLARSFPELKYNELQKLSKDYYHHMSDIMMEIIWAYTASTKSIAQLMHYQNPDLLGKVSKLGRNVLVVAGHQGCWELITSTQDLRKIYNLDIDNKDCFLAYKKMTNKVADKLITHIREHHDSFTMIESDQIFRHILKNRGGKCIYCFIADQSPAVGAKFAVNFLNQQTLMINGPEYIASKMGMPVLFAEIDRAKRGRYNLTYHLICEDASKCEEGYITKEYARLLEGSIRANKSSWLWSHKRWKKDIKLDENIKFL